MNLELLAGEGMEGDFVEFRPRSSPIPRVEREPLDKLDSFNSWYKPTIAAAFAALAIFLDNYLSQHLPLSVSLAITAFLLAIVVKGSETWVSSLFEASGWLRQLVAGKSYIEGYWVNVDCDQETNTIFCGEVTHIEYRDGKIRTSGEFFDKNGHLSGSFESITTEYHNKRLFYTYRSLQQKAATNEEEGFGVLIFSSGRRAARSITGYYIDTFRRRKVNVVGEKVTSAELLKNADTTSGRRVIVLEYMKRAAEENGYKLASINAQLNALPHPGIETKLPKQEPVETLKATL